MEREPTQIHTPSVTARQEGTSAGAAVTPAAQGKRSTHQKRLFMFSAGVGGSDIISLSSDGTSKRLSNGKHTA